MIYIFLGDDNKSKSNRIKKLSNGFDVVNFSSFNISKSILINYSSTRGLFGETYAVVIDGLINDSDISFSSEDLDLLKNSNNIFILTELKLSTTEIKKYNKYSLIENFDSKKIKPINTNSFLIADYFSNRDKMNTWIIYNQEIEKGTTPESIIGILFWKIKMMMVNKTKVFNLEELKYQSSGILSLYHKAHNGEIDINIGLEQFILKSLSK